MSESESPAADARLLRQRLHLAGYLADDEIATTVWLTACPPSVASRLALVAMPSVIFAFSLFCETDEAMLSMDALVCSTLAACSLAACESDCAVALT